MTDDSFHEQLEQLIAKAEGPEGDILRERFASGNKPMAEWRMMDDLLAPLDNQELQVFNLAIGRDERGRRTPVEIAEELGLTIDRVGEIDASIQRKMGGSECDACGGVHDPVDLVPYDGRRLCPDCRPGTEY